MCARAQFAHILYLFGDAPSSIRFGLARCVAPCLSLVSGLWLWGVAAGCVPPLVDLAPPGRRVAAAGRRPLS